MKVWVLAVFLALHLAILQCSTVEDINNCWSSSCQTEYQACNSDPKCVAAGKYVNQCEQKENCNLQPTDTWNETCWEFCNYEATPATTEKTWITFEKCHLASCKSTTDYVEIFI